MRASDAPMDRVRGIVWEAISAAQVGDPKTRKRNAVFAAAEQIDKLYCLTPDHIADAGEGEALSEARAIGVAGEIYRDRGLMLGLDKERDRATIAAMLAFARTALSPAAQDAGMVLVPREPTEAMLEAGDLARRDCTDVYMDGSEVFRGGSMEAVWSALLAAAPIAGQGEVA